MSATSSESDDSRRRGPPPPPGKHSYHDGRGGKPKKKKKPLPPQESINKIWSRFSAPQFSKATVILPFASQTSSPTSQPTSPSPQNLLVSEDYERAVQECSMKVKKLIKECRRVNMRYRDKDWDIDWDLKWEKGHCLNSLGGSKYDLNGRAFANPTSNIPKAVKRVHEIFDEPTFLKDKISPADVKQGSLGDCWLMASLTAMANMEFGIKRICVEYDTKIGIYGFVFHRDGEWVISIIDDKLYLKSPDWDSPSVQRHLLEQTDREDVEREYRKTYQTGSQSLFFAHCKDQNETWLPLLEKAYAKAHGDYAALQGGWIGEGLEDLTGGVTTELLTSDILDIDDFWNNEILKVNKEFLFGCSTGLLDGGYGNRDGISEGHAYVIMEARELSDGTRLLKLRNPWGKGKKGNWEGAWSDGSKEFTPEAQRELNHKFGNDSVFWISYKDLLRKYQHFDRTRLFMDSPEWRLTQKWISVEVPWKAEFEQKFRIVLKKESPVVLVLSQLDDRYFDGLQGQYTFRLQFRLHEVDSPGDHDYIVRSHGNYLMDRSVVTELKGLSPGTYSVFIMVTADRNLNALSVEDVVKMQCRRKVDNEKLAAVAVSYDHAHRKGAAYMEEISTARKAQDKAKARASRIALRKKNWEMRHKSRDILRKQDKKNREKRKRKDNRDIAEADAKEAKEAADEREREEKKPKDKSVQTEGVKEVPFSKEDKAVQTGEIPLPTDSPMPTQLINNDTDKGVQTEDMWASVTESQSTPETPKSTSILSPPPLYMTTMPHRNRCPPPPPPRKGSASSRRDYPHGGPPRHQQYIDSEGESSASPISDFDDMISDDDPTLKPRPTHGTGGPAKPKRVGDSDEEDDEPEPWNAVCIVGFRMYSKDEEAELKIFMDNIEDEVTSSDASHTSDAKHDHHDDSQKQTHKDEEGTDADIEDATDNGTKMIESTEVQTKIDDTCEILPKDNIEEV